VNQPESNYSNGHGQAKFSTLSADEVRERLWAYEDFAAADEHQPYNVTGSFASLGYLWAAIKRSRGDAEARLRGFAHEFAPQRPRRMEDFNRHQRGGSVAVVQQHNCDVQHLGLRPARPIYTIQRGHCH